MGYSPLITAALDHDGYSRGASDYSATDLIAPPQVTRLKRQHADQIVRKRSSNIIALLGTAMHAYLEKFEEPGTIKEERLFAEVNGYALSGQIDVQKSSDGVAVRITDHKVTTCYKVMKDSFPDWEQQLNIYAWLARMNGIEVEALEIHAILRDWRDNMTNQDGQPDEPELTIELPLWSYAEQDLFVRDRLNDLISGEMGEVRDCTDEERWFRPPVYAVWKSGGKRPSKLFDSPAAAQEYVDHMGKLYSIEERPAQYIRCERFCEAAPFCPQWQRVLQERQSGGHAD